MISHTVVYWHGGASRVSGAYGAYRISWISGACIAPRGYMVSVVFGGYVISYVRGGR
jgi:hypothetical protein